MKHKSLIVVFLFVLAMSICHCTFAQSTNLEPDDQIVLDETNAQFAQNLPQQNNVPQTINTINPIPINSYERSVISEYGIVGFTIVTTLGLIVYIVRADRTSISGVVSAVQAQAQATANQAKATNDLAKTMKAEIKIIGVGLNSRLDSLEKTVERLISQSSDT